MDVVGRDPERGRLERLVSEPARWPAGICLEASAGLGKSTLWLEAVLSARERGIRVLATAPSQPDQELAFSALGDLLGPVAEDVLEALPPPQQRALSAALALDDADPVADPYALPRAVLGSLRGVAANGPVLVAIDDEQWLDRPSARLLAFALCRLRTEPVAVLLARRPESGSVLWPELARGFTEAGMEVVVLGALEHEVIRRLIRARLGHTLGRAQLQRVCDVAGGNPLFALAIAGEIGDADGELSIPATLTDAVAQRLTSLDHETADALLVIASAARPTVALLQSAVPGFSLADLDSAVHRGVVWILGDRVGFSHPLLAAAHYARCHPAQRRTAHRRLAQALHDGEERAYHWGRAVEAPDAEIAERIEAAAQIAARRGAPETAASLLEHAARLTPVQDTERRWMRLVLAGKLLFWGGDGPRARSLLEGLLPDLPPGPILAQSLLVLAWTRSDNRSAVAGLKEALSQATGDHRLRAEIALELADYTSAQGRFADGLRIDEAAVQAAEQSGDAAMLAVARGHHAAEALLTGRVVDLEPLRAGIEIEDAAGVHGVQRPSVCLAQILFWRDELEQARTGLEGVIAQARARGEATDAVLLLIFLAWLEWYAGNVAVAEQHKHTAQELWNEADGPMIEMELLYLNALFAAGRGELDEARRLSESALAIAESIHLALHASLPATVLAWIDVWTGAPQRAHDRVSAIRERFVSHGFGMVSSTVLGLWTADIEALIACGRLDDAQVVIDDLRTRAEGMGNPHAVAIALRYHALVLAARGDVTAAIDHMQAALTEHDKRALAPEVARTRLELGSLQRRARRKTAAKRSLEHALETFTAMGARMWEARARDELSRIGLRRAAVSDGLTPAQLRVVELAAAGMSNREIASTLFMSTRTVESHLTKAYREFGVRSRAQLVAAVTAGDAQLDAG